jgi:hypothetical protein
LGKGWIAAGSTLAAVAVKEGVLLVIAAPKKWWSRYRKKCSAGIAPVAHAPSIGIIRTGTRVYLNPPNGEYPCVLTSIGILELLVDV